MSTETKLDLLSIIDDDDRPLCVCVRVCPCGLSVTTGDESGQPLDTVHSHAQSMSTLLPVNVRSSSQSGSCRKSQTQTADSNSMVTIASIGVVNEGTERETKRVITHPPKF